MTRETGGLSVDGTHFLHLKGFHMIHDVEKLTSLSRTISYATSDLTHDTLVKLVRPLDDASMGASSGPTSPSIGFHVWHSGRWADIVQAHLRTVTCELTPLPSTDGQLWLRDGWAARFGCDDVGPGFLSSGMKASADDLGGLSFGNGDLVRAYTEAAFAVADLVVAGLDAETMCTPCVDPYGRASSVAEVIMQHITHVSRHLGMIEALIGVTGRPGTATL